MHNGTLKLKARVPGKSDTWHFVTDVLRPLAQRHAGLLSDYAFVQILELGLRADNKLALLDQRLRRIRSEEHTSELQSLMRSSYAVFCLKKKKKTLKYAKK